MIDVKIKRLTPDAKIPTKANPTDAGWDLYLPDWCDITIWSGVRFIIDLEIAVSIPEGWYMRIEPRSGFAVDYGLQILAGVIDCSYRGNIKVCVLNSGQADFSLPGGSRIAQATLHRVPDVQWIETDELDQTERGNGGFGSSGR